MFTVQDISNRYQVKPHTVLHWLRTGQLRGINVGLAPGKLKPRWRISQAALDAFEASRTPTADPGPRRRTKAGGDVVEFYPATT